MRMRRFVYVLCIVSLVLVSGCSSEYTRSESPSSDWSRGLLVGTSDIRHPVALQVDAQGAAHLVWHEAPSEADETFRYVRLNRQGQVVLDRRLTITQPKPRRPQLLVDQADQLHLAWLSRHGHTQRLYHTLIDQEGRLVESVRVSREEDVSSFQMYLSGAGELAFVWSGQHGDAPPTIFQSSLEAEEAPAELVRDGIDPAVLVDRSGLTHLTWLRARGYSARDVYYATLGEEGLVPPDGVRISNFNYAESAVYYGPVIGADDQYLYILWSIQNMGGGLTPADAFAYYISFQKGEAEFISPRRFNLPSATHPDYVDYESPYTIDQLANLPSSPTGTNFVNAPSTVRRQAADLPVTLSLVVESASKSAMRIAMVMLSEGRVRGYQLASKTSNASVLSSLVADPEGNLHLAWIDVGGFSTYKIYYATTAPEARAWLDRVTTSDVAREAGDLVWGVLSGIGLSLVAMLWSILPAIWLVVFYLFSRVEHLDQLAAKISLAVAIVLYVASKLLFMPGLLAAGTPFLYQVPVEMRNTLTLAIPILVLLLAFVALYIYLRRSEEPGLFMAYVVFALSDSVLTAALYAPRFFNPE